MKYLYKIAMVSVLVCSFVFARTAARKSLPPEFESKISYSGKKEFIPGTGENNDDSLKWKRRHKRRRKAKNRHPQRGR